MDYNSQGGVEYFESPAFYVLNSSYRERITLVIKNIVVYVGHSVQQVTVQCSDAVWITTVRVA